jgi:hypothetical protein
MIIIIRSRVQVALGQSAKFLTNIALELVFVAQISSCGPQKIGLRMVQQYRLKEMNKN